MITFLYFFYFLETFRPPMFNYGVDANAYNLGIRRNFREIFGKNKLLWFFPVFTSYVNLLTKKIFI